MFGQLLKIFNLRRLNSEEKAAQTAVLSKLNIKKRNTKKSLIVAIIGLVGSGKTSVAQELAKHINATIVSSDDIRVEFRKQGIPYNKTWVIAENIALAIIEQGGNAILDSDFIDVRKQVSIRYQAWKTKALLVFVRTYCDPEITIGRIITTAYNNEFFDEAQTKWQGSERGAVVKTYEMLRRLPFHYNWLGQGGAGRWIPKKAPFKIFADINTTTEAWKEQVKKCAQYLLTK